MSAITVHEVKTADELKKFIRFPMEMYKNNKNYVPPLIKDEEDIWDPAVNAALQYSEFRRFLAFRNDVCVGRIAVMINHKEVEELGISKVRFGWLDFTDDSEVVKALLNEAILLAKEKKMTLIEGPMGFTNLDKAGMLTMGYDRVATMIGLYNHAYYPAHLEKLGLRKEKEWVEFELDFPKVLSDKVQKFSNLIAEKYKLRVLEFKSKKEILPYVEPMFRLLDETYKSLSTYTPITDEQIRTYREKYFSFIDKDYIVCIVDEHDELISFAITMPSYSRALQKANGRLFPFGWIHFLRAARRNTHANFYLIGIHPDYQRRGVTALIFKEIWRSFRKKGIRVLETNPELEENRSVQALWQDYNPVNHKRRRTYVMNITPETPLFK